MKSAAYIFSLTLLALAVFLIAVSFGYGSD